MTDGTIGEELPPLPLTGGATFLKNAVINLVGQAIPLMVALVAIPITVRVLGPDQFGILALTWLLLASFLVFDLGLGRATTKLSAEAFAARDELRIKHLAWGSLIVLGALGIVGGVLLLVGSDRLVGLVNVPAPLQDEAARSFRLLAVGLPATLAMLSIRAVLEAAQRFDLVNLVSGPSTALTYLLSAAGAYAGLSVSSIVILLILNRVGATLVYWILARRALPPLRHRPALARKTLRELISYGRWITVSSLTSPFLVYADRFLIAALLSVGDLTYYVAPYEMVTRLWIVPVAVILTLFPAFSAIGLQQPTTLASIYGRATKYIVFLVGPLVLALVMTANGLLSLWLGPDFAIRSALVYQILLIGSLLNSVAFVALALLQSIGRPDLSAKYHLASLVPFIGIAVALISAFGLVGAALAWVVRATADLVFLSALGARVVPGLRQSLSAQRFPRIAFVYLGFLSVGFIVPNFTRDLAPTVVAATIVVFALLAMTGAMLMNQQDRALAVRLLRWLRVGFAS